MTANELLLTDVHTLQRAIRDGEKKLLDIEVHTDSLRNQQLAVIAETRRIPDRLIAELRSEVAGLESQKERLLAEVEAREEFTRYVESSGVSTHQAYSEVVKKHKEAASNAVLRRKAIEVDIEKLKTDRVSHLAATSLAKKERDSIEDAARKDADELTKLRYLVMSMKDEKNLMLLEIADIRDYLVRYRADKLNLEGWEKRLKEKEKYLVDLARRLENHGVPH